MEANKNHLIILHRLYPYSGRYLADLKEVLPSQISKNLEKELKRMKKRGIIAKDENKCYITALGRFIMKETFPLPSQNTSNACPYCNNYKIEKDQLICERCGLVLRSSSEHNC